MEINTRGGQVTNMGAPISIYAYYSVAAVFACTLIAHAWRLYVRSVGREYRYRFYAERDRLIWLVATGRLKEDGRVYQFLYAYLCAIIPFVEVLKWSCVATVAEKKLTPEQESLLEAILQSPPEVIDLAKDIFVTTCDLIRRENRTAVFFGEFFRDTWLRYKLNPLWLASYNVVQICEKHLAKLEEPRYSPNLRDGALAN